MLWQVMQLVSRSLEALITMHNVEGSIFKVEKEWQQNKLS